MLGSDDNVNGASTIVSRQTERTVISPAGTVQVPAAPVAVVATSSRVGTPLWDIVVVRGQGRLHVHKSWLRWGAGRAKPAKRPRAVEEVLGAVSARMDGLSSASVSLAHHADGPHICG